MHGRFLSSAFALAFLMISSGAGWADEFSQIQRNPNTYWVPPSEPGTAYYPPGYAGGPPPGYYYGPPPGYYYGPRYYHRGPRVGISFDIH